MAKGFVVNVLGATRAKVEDISAEVEYRAFRILWLVVWSLVAITSVWLAVVFGMLTVILGFHLPPNIRVRHPVPGFPGGGTGLGRHVPENKTLAPQARAG